MLCKEKDFIIEGASVVTPLGRIENGSLKIESGIISEIGEGNIDSRCNRINAKDKYLLPGFIDLHSDAIEKEIEPRPNTFLPINLALFELDKKISSCGITTMFHSLSFAEIELGLRSNSIADRIIREIDRLSDRLNIRTKVHARYEITDVAAIPFLEKLIKNGLVHLVSIMDHTPGQGQFKEIVSFKGYYGKVYHKTDKELKSIIDRKIKAKETVGESSLRHLVDLCNYYKIPVASHDDDTAEKVNRLKDMGIRISEFPVNMEAAKAAVENDIYVCLGSPNIIRGNSQARNLSGRDAIVAGCGDIICSDYVPATLLHVVFTLEKLGILSLHEAVNMVSINPANAVGIAESTGSIETGKKADLIIVDTYDEIPKILKTFVSGREVFSTC